MKPSKMSIIRRQLYVAASVALTAVYSPAISQTAGNESGAKFVRSSNGASTFEPADVRNNCDQISIDVKFCREGTDWIRVPEGQPEGHVVYQYSEDYWATFILIPMDEDTSRLISREETQLAIEKHVFDDNFTSSTVIEPGTFPLIGPQRATKVAVSGNVSGEAQTKIVDIRHLKHGLGLFATTQPSTVVYDALEQRDKQLRSQQFLEIRRDIATELDKQLRFHQDFMALVDDGVARERNRE